MFLQFEYNDSVQLLYKRIGLKLTIIVSMVTDQD